MTLALLFDTETTGKWDFKSSLDAPHQPHLIQLAYRLIELETGKVFSTVSTLLHPQHFETIDPGAEAVHGISLADCTKFGRTTSEVLLDFAAVLNLADVAVAHNVAFDVNIVNRASVCETGEILIDPMYPLFCTMQNTTELCRLPSPYNRGYKWPKLVELHLHLFHQPFEGAHDALVDVLAMERCVLELCRRDLMPVKKSA